MRIKQCFAVLIYRHVLYNYLLMGLGVLWALSLYTEAGRARVCVRGSDGLAQPPPATAVLCAPGQSPGVLLLGNFLVQGKGRRGGAGGQSGAAGTGPAVVGTDAWLQGWMHGSGAAVGWQRVKLSPLREPKLTSACFFFLGERCRELGQPRWGPVSLMDQAPAWLFPACHSRVVTALPACP